MSKPIDQELLPCPCCSGTDLQSEPTYIMCNGCGLMIDRCDAPGNDFRAAWNKRHQPAGVAVPDENDCVVGGYAFIAIRGKDELHVTVDPTERLANARADHWREKGYVCGVKPIKIPAHMLSAPHPVSGEQKAIQRIYPDWGVVRQSDSAISIVHGATYVTFREGEDDKRMPWLVEFLSSLLDGRNPVQSAAQDVAALVEALEAARAHIGGQKVKVTPINVDGRSGYRFEDEKLSTMRVLDKIDAALSARRAQPGESDHGN